MITMRKQYTAAFKAHLVREVLKEEKPLNQIAAEHGVHRNLLTQWRDQALAALPAIFSHQAQHDQAAKDAAHAHQVHELYAEIGRLSTQLAWLKKTLGWQPYLDGRGILGGEELWLRKEGFHDRS
jgi:transposase-like protein